MEPMLFSPKNLQKVRRKAGHTQESAAAQLNVSVQTIRGYEQGVVDPPLKMLREMGRLYGVTFMV